MEKIIFERGFKALGTDICVQLVGFRGDSKKAEGDLDQVEKIYKEQEKIFSRFDKDSELSKLNNKLGIFLKVSDDLRYLAEKYLMYYEKTDRLLDPRIIQILEDIGYEESFRDNSFEKINSPENRAYIKGNLEEALIIEGLKVKFNQRMDFSGLAKGYITDKVAHFLIGEGWNDFLIDSGGDMYAKGRNKDNRKWGISLEGYLNEDEIVFEISDEGLATSGNTRKFWQIGDKKMHHLINPQDASSFNFDIKTVTVIAKTTEEADMWAKVLFLMGTEKGIDLANKNNLKCVFLKSDKSIIKSRLIS